MDKNFQSKVGNIKHSRPIKPEETPVVHSSSIDVEKRTELQPIEKFTDKSISYDVDRVLSRASSQFEDHDAVDCHDDAYAVSKSSSLRRCLIPSPDTSDERKPIEEDMLIGIADYCILLGIITINIPLSGPLFTLRVFSFSCRAVQSIFNATHTLILKRW